ncbi:Hypothetical_protein [Hexamita inflata]|nr:Hypothetical protein HINF_LOCUS35922 [Hexamita inflata]
MRAIANLQTCPFPISDLNAIFDTNQFQKVIDRLMEMKDTINDHQRFELRSKAQKRRQSFAPDKYTEFIKTNQFFTLNSDKLFLIQKQLTNEHFELYEDFFESLMDYAPVKYSENSNPLQKDKCQIEYLTALASYLQHNKDEREEILNKICEDFDDSDEKALKVLFEQFVAGGCIIDGEQQEIFALDE